MNLQDETDGEDNGLGHNGRFRRRIDNPIRVRREVAKLFFDWRAGDTTSEDAARMAGVLKALHQMLVGDSFERRLKDLESFRDQKLAR